MSEVILNDDNFEQEVIKSDVPVMVDFYADWCGPCKAMEPIIQELVEEYEGKQFKVAKMNVDEAKETPGKYGIMSIPTIIFFKGGNPVEQMVGGQTKEALQEKINGLI